jgi:hypothetical protein
MNEQNLLLKKLDEIMIQHPFLTAHGYDTKKHFSFVKERNELKTMIKEIQICIEYLDEVPIIKTINSKNNSTGYKHKVEKWTEKKYGQRIYITNGSFIAAALMFGLKMSKPRLDSVNVSFNISRKVK